MTSIKAFPFDDRGTTAAALQDSDPRETVLEMENRYSELRGYTENLFQEYERLRSEQADLREYVTAVENQRDEMGGRVSDLVEKLTALESQANVTAQTVNSLRESTAGWMEENASKLEGYELMKKLLRGLFENADTVFTDVITPEQREKMCGLLNRLP